MIKQNEYKSEYLVKPEEIIHPEKYYRPWGYYEVLAEGPGYKVKRLVVDPGKRTELEWHEKREEYWHVVEGFGEITLEHHDWLPEIHDTEELCNILTGPRSIMMIEKEQKHRINNIDTEPLVVIEVQTYDPADPGGEDDVHRVEDE